MLNIVYFCVLSEEQFMCSDQNGCFLQFFDFRLSRYFAKVFSEPLFQMFQVIPVINDMALVLKFHMFSVFIVRFFVLGFSYLLSSLHCCLQKLQDQIGYMFLFVLSLIMLSGLLLWTILSVYTVNSTICVPYLHFKICLPSYCY